MPITCANEFKLLIDQMSNSQAYSFTLNIFLCSEYIEASGGVVVKALRYKPAGRGFDSRWCHWNFSVTQSFLLHYGPGVDSASNRNDYQVYFLGVKAAGA